MAGLSLRRADRLRLELVVAQHVADDVVGDGGQQVVALGAVQFAAQDRRVEQNLEVDLVVGGVDAGRVIDEVGVDPAARVGVLDPAAPGDAEVATPGDDPAAQSLRVHSHRVVGPVGGVRVGLAACLDIGADTAVPQQVDRGAQQGLDNLGRRQLYRVDAQPPTHQRRERDGLRSPREDPAARGQHGGVVVHPGRAGEPEEPLPLGEGDLGVGVRVEEDVPMVERADETKLQGQKETVAEDVTGHVADPHDRDLLPARVHAQLAEVVPDGHPGAACGDAHRLVVVAGGATGGEGVSQPEVVLGGDLVGEVRERGGALVGGHHQVRVRIVQAHGFRRRDDCALDDVVGDVEQATDECDVAAPHLRGRRGLIECLQWSLDHERALGPAGYDHCILDVLGLATAQHVKNAVIVPGGAKGAFVVKRPLEALDKTAASAEVRRCYVTFIRGLLDITDNIVEGAIVAPPETVCLDDPDPYLVVAADKGTASFSDLANEVAAEYYFWLGDAFASGGSAGYDHKTMGITARGAWVSVRHHFRELGVDARRQEITVVGIGDMSGDVFGNGMLLSRQLRLVGAFDHRHVFLDPDPDPEISFAERERLFRLPGSTWMDYDTAVLSPGGGIFARTAKSIPLSALVRRRLGVDAVELPPAEVIQALLRAPVDLLWNGGIGTYVKASGETNTDAADRANDAVRVDAKTLRCLSLIHISEPTRLL